jgi:hypothetical protein
MMYDPTFYRDRLVQAERALRWSRDHMAACDLGESYRIDEIALLWENAAELNSFVQWASGGGGMEWFNSVQEDRMERVDKPSEFKVRFEFLKFPDADWRIEAMCVLEGEAPLHTKHLKIVGNGAIVHASFKVPTEADYWESFGWLEEAQFFKVAEYVNSYGWFSYWDSLDSLHYFKPRVNRRDAAVVVNPHT